MTKAFRLKDITSRPVPDAVHLKGLLGSRFEGSRVNRLRHQEEDHLLWPFQEHCKVGYYPDRQPKPGIRGDWQGEFMGTWLDAAILTSWNTNDGELRAKVDSMVKDWLATQQADGYLGTYDEVDRWKSWDIWVQAHDLIGLLSYYRLTKKPEILQAAVKVADRVLQDFGRGKRGVRETGPHVGMASSAFLEPLIWLYWETGKPEYLEFGRWLVDEDWEAGNGPKIISTILKGKGVAECGNSKGIEMLIDFASLLELYRATGEQRYLQTIEMAWEDIVAHHLYITGSASTGEFFPKDFVLRNEGVYQIGETCVSMGWMYLNLSLARLTGDGKYYDMAEQTIYNHLLGAQSPDGRNWLYYMGLRDSKRFRWHTDPECCPSRGVRAIAQLPTHAYTLTDDGIDVNFYDRAEASLPVTGGKEVNLNMETEYPYDGKVTLSMTMDAPAEFTLRLRAPGWCGSFALKINGQPVQPPDTERGYLRIRRLWQPGDQVELALDMPVRVVVDMLGNSGRAAITRGPLVFAADQGYLAHKLLLDEVTLLVDRNDPAAGMRVERSKTGSVHLFVPRLAAQPEAMGELWREKERYKTLTGGAVRIECEEIELVPFLEAGTTDARNYREGIQPNSEPVTHISFQVWLPYQVRG
jgi:DUF1680 family protein